MGGLHSMQGRRVRGAQYHPRRPRCSPPSALASGDSEMRDDPKLLEQLRDLFQDRVDALERSGSEHLDRWVELGARDLTRLREELEERRSRSRSGRSKRRPKRGRRHRRRSKEVDSVEAERREIRRRARRRANHRIAFLTHFGTFVATLAIILVASRSIRVAMIVALSWGIGVFIHYLWAVVAPTLRDRWVEDEVGAHRLHQALGDR